MTDKTMTLLASYLDDGGWHTEAENVRNGVDLESYENETRLIDWITRHLSQPAEPGEAAGKVEPVKRHDLYKTGDLDAPAWIKDRNGEVVLGLCRVCGQGEDDLEPECPYALRESGDPRNTAPPAERVRVPEEKCPKCNGSGERCMAGHNAHPDNWYTCKACGGTGKLSAAPEATPSPTIDVAAVREVCHVLREITINGHAPFTAQADKLALAIGDAK